MEAVGPARDRPRLAVEPFDAAVVRDRTIRRVKEVGRRCWKKESGYHQQGRVENTFFRYKAIIGDRLRARGEDAQVVEAALACNILNRMAEFGRPASVAIGA